MIDEREIVRRAAEALTPPEPSFDRLLHRRDRVQRNRRIRAGVLGIAVAIAVGWWGIEAIRSTQIPADDRSEELGVFAPVAGRILYETGVDSGYGPGYWALDPNGPSDTVPGPRVADDVASTLVPLELDGEPLGWSSDGTDLLLMRSDGDGFFPEQYLSILHAGGSETRLNEDPMGIADATISPDGTRVVFAGQYDLSGLYVIDANGGPPVQLPIPQAGEGASTPTYSPDGTHIAYLAGNRDAEVWVVNEDGTDAHEILADEPTVSRDITGLEWSPAGDRLAIGVGTHERSGGSIYTFAPDGSDFTEVIVGGSSPSWSPDGSQIAYTIQCDVHPTFTCVQFDPQAGLPPAGLAIADADGSNVRAFGYAASGPWHPGGSAEPDEATPVPSDSFARANGEVLDFTGVPLETPGDLVAVDPATGEERVLVEDLDTVYSASWSADGRWVAYETESPEGTVLWVVGASQEPRQVATGASMLVWSSTDAELATIRLTSPLHTDIAGSTLSTIDAATGETTDAGSIPEDGDVTSAPAWSPDLTRVVFGARGGAIYSVDVRSGARSLLVRLPGEHLDSVDQIVWSPDGAHIAVMIDRGGVYVMDDDGSNVHLLGGYSDRGVAWSPDGTRLAYTDGRVWVARMDGSAPTEIGDPVPLSNPETCALLCQEDLTWSPDGSRIGFRTGLGGSFEASAIDADGGGEAEPIDVITYASWAGGSYDCGCV